MPDKNLLEAPQNYWPGYTNQSAGDIAAALRGHGYNPAAKNWSLDLFGPQFSKIPELGALTNTLAIYGHGGSSGFSPDLSATNTLAKAVNERIDSQGLSKGSLNLLEIGQAMGSATNDVKRLILAACHAAGYNFTEARRIFPELQQLIAPSTAIPTTGTYAEELPQVEPRPYPRYDYFSPFFSITPNATNLINKASDWLSPGEVQAVGTPLDAAAQEQKERFRKYPEIEKEFTDDPWKSGEMQYSPAPHIPESQLDLELRQFKIPAYFQSPFE